MVYSFLFFCHSVQFNSIQFVSQHSAKWMAKQISVCSQWICQKHSHCWYCCCVISSLRSSCWLRRRHLLRHRGRCNGVIAIDTVVATNKGMPLLGCWLHSFVQAIFLSYSASKCQIKMEMNVTLGMVNELYAIQQYIHSSALFVRTCLAAHHLQCNFIQSQCEKKCAKHIALNKAQNSRNTHNMCKNPEKIEKKIRCEFYVLYAVQRCALEVLWMDS